MSAISGDFSSRWAYMISPEAESSYFKEAVLNGVATVAITVGYVALAALAGIAFHTAPGLLTLAALVVAGYLLPHAIDFAKLFANKIFPAFHRSEQAGEVRKLYEVVSEENRLNIPNFEAKILSTYWNGKAVTAELAYSKFALEINELGKEPGISSERLHTRTVDLLSEQKAAADLRIKALFFKSLENKEELFQKAFLRYESSLPFAINDFATFDARDPERRLIDRASPITHRDDFLIFNNERLFPISYDYLFNRNKEGKIQILLLGALAEKLKKTPTPIAVPIAEPVTAEVV